MNGRSTSALLRREPWPQLLWHTPLTALVIFVLVCLIAKENFPFSHFPMYSRPGAERGYLLVTDGDGQPIPVQNLTGVTASHVGKAYRTKSKEFGRKTNPLSTQSRTDRDRIVGIEIFQMLREQSANRGKDLPEKLQLHMVEIRFEDGEIKENKRVLFAE
ncbi:MAG TPA: hypothetical protein VM574_11785 [Terrimicrobiaceae bacterium]|nr:hypothetical protein [Terrimicrobiaceae bacterium]